MKTSKSALLISCLILFLTSCTTKPLYLVQQKNNLPHEDTRKKCLSIAQDEMRCGIVFLTKEETLILKGVETERFLWWGSSSPRVNIDYNGNPTEHQSLIPTTDPYKINLSERYVLCLLRSGYTWLDENEAGVKERLNNPNQLERRINDIPMYGQPEIPRSDSQKKDDEAFIDQASREHGGDRKAASKAYYMQGDKYFKEGNHEDAMRRFNQAWLLDSDWYGPYAGFGYVASAQCKFDDALKYYEKSRRWLVNDKYDEGGLALNIAIAYNNKANMIKDNPREKTRYYDLANQKFKECTDIDPAFGDGWIMWAASLYKQWKYEDAWQKIKKAQALGAKIPEDFLKMLREKMPELK